MQLEADEQERPSARGAPEARARSTAAHFMSATPLVMVVAERCGGDEGGFRRLTQDHHPHCAAVVAERKML